MSKNEEKAQIILAGALQEFLENGYMGASMDKLAQTARVSKPTLYKYFDDKEALFKAVVKSKFEEFQENVKILQQEIDLDAQPRVILYNFCDQLLNQMLCNAEQHHDFIRLIIGESGRFPELAQTVVGSIHKPIIDKLAYVLSHHSLIRCHDPEMTATTIMASLVYFMMTQYICQASHLLFLERERFVNNIVAIALNTGIIDNDRGVVSRP
jgi:AcrR family transcriptional regulator